MTEQTPPYYTPANIINPGAGTGDMKPAADLVNPPYYVETTVQRLARLGVELAQLRRQEHNSPMTLEHINKLIGRMEAITNEILTISENWERSNE